MENRLLLIGRVESARKVVGRVFLGMLLAKCLQRDLGGATNEIGIDLFVSCGLLSSF